MTHLGLKISPAARADLSKMYHHSLGVWGKSQANDYLNQIKQLLLEQPLMGIERADLTTSTAPNIRSIVAHSHVIFYRLSQKKLEIIRVLHERQDPEKQFS